MLYITLPFPQMRFAGGGLIAGSWEVSGICGQHGTNRRYMASIKSKNVLELAGSCRLN